MIIRRRRSSVYEIVKDGKITQVITRQDYFGRLYEQLKKNNPFSNNLLRYMLMRICRAEIESQEFVIEIDDEELPIAELENWQEEETEIMIKRVK